MVRLGWIGEDQFSIFSSQFSNVSINTLLDDHKNLCQSDFCSLNVRSGDVVVNRAIESKRNNSDIMSSCALIHINAHFDYNSPEATYVKFDSMADVVKYTHEILKGSTYIQAAKTFGIFGGVFNFVETKSSEKSYTSSVLDSLISDGIDDIVVSIDLDIFALEMSHITFKVVLSFLKAFKSHAGLMSFVMSPGYIDQEPAVGFLYRSV
jgi:hypothetical protein